MAYYDDMCEVWELVRESFHDKLSSETINLWFGTLRIVSFKGRELTMSIKSPFKYDIIKEKYLGEIKSRFSKMLGFDIDIVLLLEDRDDELIAQSEKPDEEKTVGTLGSTMPPYNFEYTFDNFIRGKSNEEAFNFSMGVANAPAKSYNPLFLYSDPGLGKTHLMNAIGNYIHKKFPQMKILYTSSETFTNELIGAIQHNTNEAFRNKYRNIDVLLIDDIQFLRKKESTQEEFFHTFEALKQADKQIIISSDRPPKELDTLEERLTSRFMQGLIIEINHPDFETRSAILRSMAEKDHLEFPLEVIQLIATNVKTNIRELEGAYTKVHAFANLNHQPVTMELARKALAQGVRVIPVRGTEPGRSPEFLLSFAGIPDEKIREGVEAFREALEK